MIERIVPSRPLAEPPTSGSWLGYVLYGIAAIVVVAGALALYSAMVAEGQKFAPVYTRLGMEALPKNLENMPYIKADLIKLMEAPCDKFNKESLAQGLDNLGQNGWATVVRRGYVAHCTTAVPVTGPEEMLAHLATNGTDPETRRLARELQGNFCNQPALLALQFRIRDAKDITTQVALGDAYLARCGLDDDVAYNVMIAHFNLGQFETALAMARRNDEARPNTAYWPAWIGKSLMRLGRPSEAADAFLRSLSRWSNPAKVDYIEYWNASDALRAAGRYCEAMRPLEQYVSYDPVKRLAPSVQNQLTSFAKLGNCS